MAHRRFRRRRFLCVAVPAVATYLVVTFGAILGGMLICGAIAAAIGQKKKFSAGGCFALGAVLGVIGIIMVIAQRPALPKAPPGMRVVKCSRCNAVQNIPLSQTEFHCWQCQFVNSAGPAIGPEDGRQWLNRVKDETKREAKGD
jgi:MFS family permease